MLREEENKLEAEVCKCTCNKKQTCIVVIILTGTSVHETEVLFITSLPHGSFSICLQLAPQLIKEVVAVFNLITQTLIAVGERPSIEFSVYDFFFVEFYYYK